MPGGLLNIIAFGNANIILNGNPTKTFFKTTYAKHTNFGMQKFRLDYNGSRDIDPNNDSVYTFKVPRHAELLMDTYFVFTVPNIWSTILPPGFIGDIWKAYQFKWIENLGTSCIKNIRIIIGTQVIQEYDGEYIRCMVERDYSEEKKKQFDYMTGNVDQLHHPERHVRNSIAERYPNTVYSGETLEGPEPSIRGRKIYVPLCPWFMNHSKLALPLVCLQYSEVTIEVTMRPIREMFTINNVSESTEKDVVNYDEKNGTEDEPEYIYENIISDYYQRIQPNFSYDRHNLYRFLQPPPSITLTDGEYADKTNNWNADVHIIANYGFLTPEESKVFALNEQKYLIKDIKRSIFYNIVGTKKVKVESNALVSNWMWFYRRNDAYKRNEWSNYTNWKTSSFPFQLESGNEAGYNISTGTGTDADQGTSIGPAFDLELDGTTTISTNHYVTPLFSLQHEKFILNSFSILIDGKIRENEFDSGVYQYVEKYQSTKSSQDFGIYHYHLCLDSANYLQPTGAINLSRFKNIEFEMTTLIPEQDASAVSLTLCDENGGVIGVTKEEPIYIYMYDMYLFEERYNILRFISGNAGLLFAR